MRYEFEMITTEKIYFVIILIFNGIFLYFFRNTIAFEINYVYENVQK